MQGGVNGHETNTNTTQVASADEATDHNKATIDQANVRKATSSSYASMFKSGTSKHTVKITEMRNNECVTGANITLPLAEVEEVSNRFANTLYGYFIGKRLAFPIVENYVKNTWAKFGLERVMLNNSFFLFQFATKEGMEKVLENGPWLIRLNPIILNIWTPNSKLTKEEITSAPVWVKIHNVPIVAYTEVGLSLITTQIGRPIMLDAYTSSMCLKSWGRNSYARALVEVSSHTALLESLVIAIPFPNGTGHSLEKVDIEYEWKPPRCEICKIFDHTDEACPKSVKQAEKSVVNDDGFIEVNRKNGKGKQPAKTRNVEGIRLSKPKVSYYYRPINKQASTSGGKASPELNDGVSSTSCKEPTTDPTSNTTPSRDDQDMNNIWVDDINRVDLKNSFDVLTEKDAVLEPVGNTGTPDGTSSSSKTTYPSPLKNTPITDKIGKIEKLIIDGKATLVDNDGKPLKKAISSTKVGSNPFSKVGNVIVSDSDDDEVFDDDIGTLYSGSGGKEHSLYKQWKADTGDGNNYDEDDFDLSPAQLKAARIQDFCLN